MAEETTTKNLKAQHPDLSFFKTPPLDEHPAYKDYGIKFRPGEREHLPKGHVKAPGRRAVLTDITLEYDVAVPMRDGVKVYVDVFRPASEQEKVPAIMAWSPYGKRASPWSLDIIPYRLGVHLDQTSGYESWEAPDPGDWCARGYAVVNCDSRGTGYSEGTTFFWGQQDAEDIYDTIDFLSKQSWCNGSVTMAGNSYLAIAQTMYASRLNHPACKCIAPWEGVSDVYSQLLFRGGIPSNQKFFQQWQSFMHGKNEAEDMIGYAAKHPLYNSYWKDKTVDLEKITIPVYVVSSYSNLFHVHGSHMLFRKASTKQKWLRVHNYYEWVDQYTPRIVNDLQRFYDRYCKNIPNGWEDDTPPVRLSLLGMSSIPDVIERAEHEYPLARQNLRKFYLDASSKTLVPSLPSEPSSASHKAHSLTDSSDFTLHFPTYTEVAGYSKARLYLSCADHNDMDIAVLISKIDEHGKSLTSLNFPSPVPASQVPDTNTLKTYGSQGFLRASHAISRNEAKSTELEIVYDHDRTEAIEPLGKIVMLEITLWPMGMVFAAGEGIVVKVAGHSMIGLPFGQLTQPEDANVGRHVLYTGGEFDSHVVLPVVSEGRS